MRHGLLWGLGALVGSSLAQSPSVTTPPTSTNTACALASSAASSYLAKETDATTAVISAELAYSCMRSVPLVSDPAISLLNSLRTYLEFQSSKEYLRNPPEGYLLPAVDIDTEYDAIQQKVEAGGYDNEYDLQIDIVALLMAAHDGHFSWSGDLYSAFSFVRRAGGGGLYAVSSDGVELPLIYTVGKLRHHDCPPSVFSWLEGRSC